MKTNDTENIGRLPKWAQSKIQVLERNLAEARRQLGETGKLLEYREPGVGYQCGMERRSIPSDRIEYVTGSGVRFSLNLNKDEQLEVNISGYGYEHPVVFPRSSNHIFIGICPPKS